MGFLSLAIARSRP